MRRSRTEQAAIWRSEALPGVEMMRARYLRHSFSRHFHEGYCLGVIEDGALAFRYRGRNLVAPAGSVNLAVPGEVHDGHGAGQDGWAYRMFYLEPQTLLRAAAQLSPVPGRLPHFEPGVLADPWLASALAGLHRRLEHGSFPTLETQTRFLSILAHWIRRHAELSPASFQTGREHRAVARARDIMEQEFTRDLGLDELARACALSPYHLVRTFTAQVGMPPHAYLTQVRVSRAARRLAGSETLADIAAATGFADQSHLTRWFKRLRGVTPGQYRKNVQDR